MFWVSILIIWEDSKELSYSVGCLSTQLFPLECRRFSVSCDAVSFMLCFLSNYGSFFLQPFLESQVFTSDLVLFSIIWPLTYYSKFGSFHDVPHILYVPLVFSKRISNSLFVLSASFYYFESWYSTFCLIHSSWRTFSLVFYLGYWIFQVCLHFNLSPLLHVCFFTEFHFQTLECLHHFHQLNVFLGITQAFFIFKFSLISLTWFSASSLNSLIVW